MTDPHPFKQPYDDRDAAALLAETKLRLRQVMADAAEVRNTDLTGQYGGIYIRTLSANFNLDTEDTQDDDDLNVIIDGGGNHFLRAADSVAPSSATYGDDDVSAGAISVAEDDDYVVIDTTSQVNVNWPSASSRDGRPLFVIDAGGHGFIPVMDGSDTLNGGLGSVYTVSTPKGWLSTFPISDGYVVNGAQL